MATVSPLQSVGAFLKRIATIQQSVFLLPLLPFGVMGGCGTTLTSEVPPSDDDSGDDDATVTVEPYIHSFSLLAAPDESLVVEKTFTDRLYSNYTLNQLKLEIKLAPEILDPANASVVAGFPSTRLGSYTTPLYLVPAGSQSPTSTRDANVLGNNFPIQLGPQKIGNDRFEINFTALEGAAQYSIYVDNQLYARIDVANLSDPSVGDITFAIGDLDPGTEYIVRVVANTGEASDFIPVKTHWAEDGYAVPDIFAPDVDLSNTAIRNFQVTGGVSYLKATWDRLEDAVVYQVCQDNGMIDLCEETTNNQHLFSRLSNAEYSIRITAYPSFELAVEDYVGINLEDPASLSPILPLSFSYQVNDGETVPFNCTNLTDGCSTTVNNIAADSTLLVTGTMQINFAKNSASYSSIRPDLYIPDGMHAVPLEITYTSSE